jgi:branched-chain amino acid transport system ATP-binding protein
MSDSGLRIEGLSVTIGKAEIVRQVDLTVSYGEVVGIVGSNGAGKTTTLRAISGAFGRPGGTMTLDDEPLPTRMEAVARRGVVHVPEGRALFPSLTVEDNVRIGAIGGGRGASRDVVQQALSYFPALERLRSQKAGRLSGGEQQMVALARGLASRPKVLLVDEMSLGLSPKAVQVAMALIADIAHERKIGVLLVDQGARLLARYSDRLYFLTDGRTREWDGAQDLSEAYFT